MSEATYGEIETAKAQLANAKHDYLQRFGWKLTCNIPGAYWMWRRDFASEDAERHRNWKERGPGPLGWPSEPKPYGAITADTDQAVSMTRSCLDQDEEPADTD